MIPHSEDAVQVTQHFANHFIRFVVVGCNLYCTFQVGNISSGYPLYHYFVEMCQKLMKDYRPFLWLSVTLLFSYL
jgi:hypothetical protein